MKKWKQKSLNVFILRRSSSALLNKNNLADTKKFADDLKRTLFNEQEHDFIQEQGIDANDECEPQLRRI